MPSESRMSTPQSSARAEARPDTRCPKDTLIQDDALCAMSNHLIGVYFLLPVVRNELNRFVAFSKRVDAGASIEEADAAEGRP